MSNTYIYNLQNDIESGHFDFSNSKSINEGEQISQFFNGIWPAPRNCGNMKKYKKLWKVLWRHIKFTEFLTIKWNVDVAWGTK